MGLLCARHSQLPTGYTAKTLSQPGERMEKGKEWKKKLQVQSRYTPASPGGNQAGADIHTAAHEGNVGYFWKELHPMENCW